MKRALNFQRATRTHYSFPQPKLSETFKGVTHEGLRDFSSLLILTHESRQYGTRQVLAIY
jgi:hypothetical protein